MSQYLLQDCAGLRGGLTSGAIFSPCDRYRYALWRRWWGKGPMVAFVGLNPSTATEVDNDPTVTRCINFAKAWEFGGMYMLNAFSYRSTDPKKLKDEPFIEGPEDNGAAIHDRILKTCADDSKFVVCAWGNHCHDYRQQRLRKLLEFCDVRCFGLTMKNKPKHPLYLSANSVPMPWNR